ncbi:MAG: carbohydrate ABC transporter permease [Armatimonadetes bacterium]|nr:carbohydrate ABC transporter permease [Armatimonadota bacterium]
MRLSRLLTVVALVLASLVFLTPFYMSLMTALKTPGEIATTSNLAPPQNLTWDNFRLVLTNENVSFFKLFFNTLFIAVAATTGVLVSSSVVAYAFARVKFPGRDRLFIVLLGTMMLPGIVTMIPSYLLFKNFGWINTNFPLWVPAWFGGGAYNIFLLRQFFMGIPRELDEAAVIDGASHWTIFSRVITPLSKPALATVGVFAVIYNWRDFLGPLIYLNDSDKQTLELGLSTFNSLNSQQWNLLMAGSVLVLMPLVVVFFLGQRYFVNGISMSGIK